MKKTEEKESDLRDIVRIYNESSEENEKNFKKKRKNPKS